MFKKYHQLSNLLSLQSVMSNTSTIMKSVRIKDKNQQPKNWILPGTSISYDEFQDGIKEAEKGQFHTIQESMENFELWLKSREKK
jgi:hypothetical protein